MSVNYRQLEEFQKKLEKMNVKIQEEFIIQSCCKELTARLLRKVIKRTPSDTGTLRRGWTAGSKTSAQKYADSLSIQRSGSKYTVDVINPVEYASYVEYGHRTANHTGWVEGRHMLTISESELRNTSASILQKKLVNFMKDEFK